MARWRSRAMQLEEIVEAERKRSAARRCDSSYELTRLPTSLSPQREGRKAGDEPLSCASSPPPWASKLVISRRHAGADDLGGSDQPWTQEFHRHGLDRMRDGLREHKVPLNSE